ncbi:MAG: hypothetical protein LBK06_03850, partial [Planctomycetaceae bacterium]|jgi:hypothetical protein|nr:hypothetical protein [Planctomycetaceae bacterium]
MTMAVVKGGYSQFLSYEEFMDRRDHWTLRNFNLNQEPKKLATENIQDASTGEYKTIYATTIKDEYIPSAQSTTDSSDQQSSSVYEKPNYSQSSSFITLQDGSSISIEDYNKDHKNFADINPEAKHHEYLSYLWMYSFFNVDLSACDLASSEYTVKWIQGENGTVVGSREVNGEPKIYSLDKIYKATNPDTGILYKKVSSPVNEPVPEEVKELGDWYVKHWNEISVSYVSNESKIVSSDDEDLTREEQMKIYALKSAVLFQQLHANEEAGLKKENYYIRDPLTNINRYKVATNPYINSLMQKFA